MGAGDFIFRIRGEMDMSQIRSELQGIVAAADASLAHLSRKAVGTGDTSTLTGLTAKGPGASTIGSLPLPGGSTLADELNAAGVDIKETGKIYKLLRAHAQRALDAQKHFTEGQVYGIDEKGKEGFLRVPLGQALGLELSEDEMAKATSLRRARVLTSLRPAGGFPGGSPGAALEGDIQARAQLVAGNDWLNATKRLAYSQYILSKEGEDILQVQAEEKAAFIQRIAAERNITNAILAADETYKANEAAQRANFQATQAQIKERTTKITGSNQGLQDSIVNENLASQRVQEFQKINVSRELLGLKRLELDEQRPLIGIIAERRRLDTLVNEELKRQEVLIVEQNSELQSAVATETTGPTGRVGLFQRFLGATRGGAAEDQPGLGQFLGSKLATTAGFAATGALTYGTFALLSAGLKDVREFESHAAILQEQLRAIGKGDQFDGLKASIIDISTNTGQKASELADIAQRFVGEFHSAQEAAEALDRAAKIAVVSSADLNTVAEAIQAGTKNFGASAKEIGDLAVQIQNAFGTPQKETLQFFGQTAPVASQYGFSAKQAAIFAGGLTSEAPSRTGASEAESLNRILPEITQNAAKLVGFQQTLGGKKIFNIDDLVQGNYQAVLTDLLKNFDGLTHAQQVQLLANLGASRVQKDAIALFKDRAQILDLLTGKEKLHGSVDDEFSRKQDTLKLKLAEAGAEFRKFVQAIYDSGLGDLLKDAAGALSSLAATLNTALSAFEALPQPIREVALAIVALNVALKLLGAIGIRDGIIGISTSIAGVGTSAAAAETAVGGFAGARAAAAAGGIGAGEVAGAGGALGFLNRVPLGARATSGLLGAGSAAAGYAAADLASGGTLTPLVADAVLGIFDDKPKALTDTEKTKVSEIAARDAKATRDDLIKAYAALFGKAAFNKDGSYKSFISDAVDKGKSDSGSLSSITSIQNDIKGLGSYTDAPDAFAADLALLELRKRQIAERKKVVLALLKQGKITQEVADHITSSDDLRVYDNFLNDERSKGVDVDGATKAADATSKKGKAVDLQTKQFFDKLDAASKSGLDPTELEQSFQRGEISLEEYRSKMQQLIGPLERISKNNETNKKTVEALKKREADLTSKALQADIDSQAQLIKTLGGPDTQKDLENLYLRALGNPDIKEADRTNDIANALQAEQQKFQDFVNSHVKAADRLAALKAGWKIPKELTTAIYTQLASTDTAYRDFIGSFAKSVGLTVDAVTAQAVAVAVETHQSLHDVLLMMAQGKLNVDKVIKQGLEDQAAGNDPHGQHPGDQGKNSNIDAINAQIAQDQATYDAIANQPDVTAETLKPTPTEVDSATKAASSSADTAAADARAYREALNAFYKAKYAYDPVKQAELDIQLANQHDRDADLETTDLKRKAAHIRAQAERISADRRLQQAFAEIFEGQLSLAQAIAQSAGNTIEAAKKGLEIAYVKLLEIIQEDGGAEQAKRDPRYTQAQAAIVSQQRAVYDAQLKDREGTIEFNLSVKRITEAQALAQYQSLLANAALLHLTTESRRELQKKIFDLKQGLSQDLQFNLPSDLRLPTLYEARRFNETGGNYQDNRQISIVLHANSKFEGQQALNTIVSSLNAAPRFGTRPRSY